MGQYSRKGSKKHHAHATRQSIYQNRAQGGVGIAFAAFADTAAAWQKLVADFRAAPPEKPAGQSADGEPPPAPGLFV